MEMEKRCVNPRCAKSFRPRNAQHAFCSEHCRREARGRNWRITRSKALWRDGHKCCKCGAVGYLEVHHILPLSWGGTSDLTNLRTLCVTCHRRVHKLWRAYANRGGNHGTGKAA